MRRFAFFFVVIVAGVSAGVLWHQAHHHVATTVSTTTSTSTAVPIAAPMPVCASTSATTTAGGTSTIATNCSTWHPLDAWASASEAPVEVTTLPIPGGLHAYAAWMRTSNTALGLYLGYKGPGATTKPRGPEAVPAGGRATLLATFNSGFYETDGAAGFYTNHTLYFPMRKGLATVERLSDGTVDIVNWTGGPIPPSNVVMARQNLPLLVDNSAPTPLSAVNADWGLTLHGVAAVWRTALGIDQNGNLIYVAAPAQTSSSLAHVLVALHCVRAMELDINPEWPIFVTYAGPGAKGPTLRVPNPNQIATRFLYSSTKDFFALFSSSTPGAPTPW